MITRQSCPLLYLSTYIANHHFWVRRNCRGHVGELLPLTCEDTEDQKQKWPAWGLTASWCLSRFSLSLPQDLLLPPRGEWWWNLKLPEQGPQARGLNNRNLSPHTSRGLKFKIKRLAKWASSWGFCRWLVDDCHLSVSSHDPPFVHTCVLISSNKDTSLLV